MLECFLLGKMSPRTCTSHIKGHTLSDLLEQNREIGLNEVESAELDWYEYVHDIMARLKAQVRPGPRG